MPENNIIGVQPPEERDYTTLYLAAMVMLSLRAFYSGDSGERIKGLQHIYWSPDNHTDGGANDPGSIVIDNVDMWNPSRVGSRPAIYVRMNDFSYLKYGLAGNQHIAPGVTDPTGKEAYTKGFAGSLSIFCLSGIPTECRLLGIDVARNLQHFAKSIRRKLKLGAFEVTKVQAPRPLREKPSHLATIVTVEYGGFESWNLVQIAPILTDVRIRPVGTGPRHR